LPLSNTILTPVFATTGTVVSGRREITENDIIKMASQFDIMAVEKEDRVCVLHDTHYNQLIANSTTFKNQISFQGMLGSSNAEMKRTFGNFKIYTYNNNAIYDVTTGVKRVLGAAPSANDSISSFFFSKQEVLKALDDPKMFFTPDDPRAQGDIMNFQLPYIVRSIRNNKFTGAIYAGN
jgi:hypothetical protein